MGVGKPDLITINIERPYTGLSPFDSQTLLGEELDCFPELYLLGDGLC